MNVRSILMTPPARRCSAAAVATTTAALLLTPATAFASGHPAGPGRPASTGHVGTGHAGTGHAGTGHVGTGHGTGSHGGGHKHDKKTGKSTGHNGHKKGHATGHTTGHPTGSNSAAGSHRTPGGVHHAAADPGSMSGSASTSASSADGGAKSPKSGSSTTSTAPKSGSKKAPESGPMATVIKLSLSKKLLSTRPLTMSARVSLAHRTVGAPRETGTVVFSVDGSSSGPVAVTNNRASAKVKLSPGRHTAVAKYSGDSAHSPSDSGPMSFTVD
ncbi:Ig-like domain-containing protein [Catenulispora yoronensis]